MPLHEEHKKRRVRNWTIAGLLIVLVILFYLATIAKMAGGGNLWGH
jgi:hypothetical protein